MPDICQTCLLFGSAAPTRVANPPASSWAIQEWSGSEFIRKHLNIWIHHTAWQVCGIFLGLGHAISWMKNTNVKEYLLQLCLFKPQCRWNTSNLLNYFQLVSHVSGQSFSRTVEQPPALHHAMLFLPSWHLFATFMFFYLDLAHKMKQKHCSILQHCCRVYWELVFLPGCYSFWSRHRLPTCGRWCIQCWKRCWGSVISAHGAENWIL